MSSKQLETVEALRHCLNYVLEDILTHDLPLTALHVRLALVELAAEAGLDMPCNGMNGTVPESLSSMADSA